MAPNKVGDNFKCIFSDKNYFDWGLEDPDNIKSVLVWQMAWHQTSDRQLPETKIDPYWRRHMAYLGYNKLTRWGWVTHICVSKQTIVGSDNGLSPGRRQAIIWTNAGILLIWLLGINFSEILIEIHIFSSKKMHLECRLRNGVHFVSA